MLTQEQVIDICSEQLEGTEIKKGGNRITARCPFCGDSKKSKTKKRFHLDQKNDNTWVFHCFNCDIAGNFYLLYSHLNGITPEEAYKKFNKYNKQTILNRINKKQKKNNIPNNINKLHDFSYILKNCISNEDEPKGFIQKKYKQLLLDFIEKRKIQEKLYIAYEGEYKGRIIIPIWYQNKLIYFQGRRVFSEMEPKYLNITMDKQNIIPNIEKFDKNKYIIITEGLLDAFSIGNQGTSILGKEVQQQFINTVKQKTDKGVILSLDNDKDGKEKTIQCIEQFRDSVLYLIYPKKYKKYKDLNEIFINSNNINMYGLVVKNSMSAMGAKTKIKMEG